MYNTNLRQSPSEMPAHLRVTESASLGGATATTASPIAEAMSNLNIQINGTRELISRLQQKLAPILAPKPTSNAVEPDKARSASTMTEALNGFTGQLAQANHDLNDLLYDVEL
jgi:hypothetical protein